MLDEGLRACIDAPDRFALWSRFVADRGFADVAEIGVLRGGFARRLLADAACIRHYTMIDPWRHIPSWNKPANTDDATFESHFLEAMAATAFAAGKRRVLRGTTIEMIDQVPDGSLDFAYIDGDHTLKGITLDLVSLLPKVRDGGWIAGDDCCDSIWQHAEQFEPSMVFPFVAYFAEAHGLVLHLLPHNQFAMRKRAGRHAVVDLTGRYGDTSVRRQVRPPRAATP